MALQNEWITTMKSYCNVTMATVYSYEGPLSSIVFCVDG